jgi:DNA replication protein DnaC
VTSSKPFGCWGEVSGDDTGAAAMIDDRLVQPRRSHQPEKGDSYRLKNKNLGPVPAANTSEQATNNHWAPA